MKCQQSKNDANKLNFKEKMIHDRPQRQPISNLDVSELLPGITVFAQVPVIGRASGLGSTQTPSH